MLRLEKFLIKEKVSFEVENKPDNDDHKPVKDSYVNKYIFTNDGKQTIYNGSRETTLEEIKDKSNEEILKIAKKKMKKYLTN